MAKKKKSNLGPIFPALSVLLGLVAVVMLFLPAVAVKNTDTTYTGLQITFGYSVAVPVVGDFEIFKFSFMNLLPYILVVGGIVFAVLSAMGKGSGFASFIAAAAFIVAGVFFLLQASFIISNDLTAAVSSFLGVNLKDGFTLAYGGIIAMVCSFLAGALSLLKVFVK